MDWPKCEYKTETERARLQAKYATGLPSDYIYESKVCENGNLIGWRSGYNYGPCPACNGTGERDLTADEAYEYIMENAKANCAYLSYQPRYPNRVGFELTEGIKVGGKALTAALNAAARAVRNRG